MKKITMLIAMSAAVCGTAAGVVYQTEFRSGTTVVPVFTSGGFTATISYTGTILDVFADPDYGADVDPSLRTVDNGTVTLTFNQAVNAISFDFGGVDSGDSAAFSVAPGLSDAMNVTSLFDGGLQLTGTTVSHSGIGARLTFTGLNNVTTFSWTNTGTWTFYDNFSFTAVPEPATGLTLLIGGGLLGLIRRFYGRV